MLFGSAFEDAFRDQQVLIFLLENIFVTLTKNILTGLAICVMIYMVKVTLKE